MSSLRMDLIFGTAKVHLEVSNMNYVADQAKWYNFGAKPSVTQ